MIDEQGIIDLLDPSTAANYKLFLRHKPLFLALEDAGVFNAKNAQVILNLDHHGTITRFSVTSTYSVLKRRIDDPL